MKRIGVMVDCSRNAVRTVDTLKKFIDFSKKSGMNTLYLYIEDVYEIPGEPYFGYLRGRYSIKELKEIDDYGFKCGIEVIPCIQTLAHLNQAFKWDCYKEINDTNDILLVGEDKTYEFIRKELETISNTFRSKYIHIGMDEAFVLGRGKYMDKHGYTPKKDIFFPHLNKVYEICEELHLDVVIWSDMIFRSAANSNDYYITNAKLDMESIKKLPKNVSLCYWDYYHEDKKTYDLMINEHQQLGNRITFGCGTWSWNGFVPDNKYGIKVSKPGIKSALQHGIDEIMITNWGDNGSECPLFANLPVFYYCASLARGISNISEIKKGFKETTGCSYDDFIKVDLPNNIVKGKIHVNPSKYLLYNDPFLGVVDSAVKPGSCEVYNSIARKMKRLSNNIGEYSYISDMYYSLCKTLFFKGELGINTRKAYLSNNMYELNKVIVQYNSAIKWLKVFIKDFRNAWFYENKPHGFDIQELRLGGTLLRLESCRDRLNEFTNGKIKDIPELDELILDFDGKSKEKLRQEVEMINNFTFTASANIF